ncbi:MAG: terminase TerL endonuclease subunit [bacterium]
MRSEKRADHAVRFIEALKHTKSPFYGVPFTLLDWQRQIVREVFGTVNKRGLRTIRYVYIEIPKKNGKSEFCAATGLYHTFADGEINGEVYGCAAEREQASIVFDVAVDMIDQVPALKERAKLNLSKKRITDKVTGTYYQVLSAESYTKHGFNLSACVFDELHAQPSRGLFDVMTHGAGDARLQPIWWIITTAGDDPDRTSIGWEIHEKATDILNGKIKLKNWYPVIYNYAGDDIYKEANWKKANPSLGHTIEIEKVREAAEEAKSSKADERLFRQLRLNQWTTTKLSSWLPLYLWDAAKRPWKRYDMQGEDCYLGGDFSTTTDLASVCLIFPPQANHIDWRWSWENWIPEEALTERVRTDHVFYDEWANAGWITPTPGASIDYTTIEATILDIMKQFNVIELGADIHFATMLLQRLVAAGLVCADIQQTYRELTDPMNIVETFLRERKATHDGNLLVRWAFGNTSIHKNGNAQIKYVKEHRGHSIVRTKRIDPIAALVCGMARAKLYNTEISIYDQRGLITF